MKRRLSAILAADMVGYSRLMAADEAGTLSRLRTLRAEVIDPAIATRDGRIVKTMGDGLLVEFASVVDGVEAALEIQRRIALSETGTGESRVAFRIGIHLGDVIIDGQDILGDGVNIAARLEGIAEPGGVCLSRAAWEQVKGKISATMVALGPQSLKNLPSEIDVWSVEVNSKGVEATTQTARKSHQTNELTRPSIAILPFTIANPADDAAFLAEGLAEELIASLSRIRWLFVIASGSSRLYSDPSKDPRTIASELSVAYVVQGSIMKSKSKIRIIAKLIDGTTGKHLRVVRADRDYDDVFDIIDSFALSISGELLPEIAVTEIEAAKRKHPDDLNAWELYLRSLPLIRECREEACDTAAEMLREAVSRAPDFAPAHARLATCVIQKGYFGWGGRGNEELVIEALEYARTALNADADEPLAYDALASANQLGGDYSEAVRLASKAIEISPNCVAAYGTLVTALAFLGQPEEALTAFEMGIRVSPQDPDRSSCLMGVAVAHFISERFEEAEKAAREHSDLRPNWYASHIYLAASAGLLGKLNEARIAGQRVLELLPGLTLEEMRKRTMLRRERDVDLLLRGLHAAGIPPDEKGSY